jgi:hypothetical protein
LDQVQDLLAKIGTDKLMIGGGVVVGLFVIRGLWKMMKPKPEASGSMARCNCGWSGRTSRYRPKCPKCGKEPQFV